MLDALFGASPYTAPQSSADYPDIYIKWYHSTKFSAHRRGGTAASSDYRTLLSRALQPGREQYPFADILSVSPPSIHGPRFHRTFAQFEYSGYNRGGHARTDGRRSGGLCLAENFFTARFEDRGTVMRARRKGAA